MKKIDMYPSSIYIDGYYNANHIEKLTKEAIALSELDSIKNSCSVRDGWQSAKDIYKFPLFSKIGDYILHKTKTELLKNDFEPFISAMWLNVHNKNGFNHVHVHPGGWYSGVYYIKCSERSGRIKFTDPRPGAEMSIYHQAVESDIHAISPKVGDLILFPSWLPHLVESNYDDADRISLSFNIELNNV